ncbi:MAG: hypothetical protein ACRD12_12275 [Acidimicrobiales bacterium]
MRTRRRLVGLLLGLSALTVVVVPLTGASAQVEDTIHWGQSPYYPTCLEGPCRVVLIADKTGDAGVAAQVHRWIDWMNYVRVNYVISFPAFAYVGPLDDGSCATAPGFISLCRSNTIVNADCDNNPNAIRCTVFNYGLSDNHITWSRTSMRPIEVDGADTWTLVCGALGRAIGLPQTSDANSCMNGTLTIGSGQEKYYTNDDWLSLISTYNHPAGS